jgi:phage portal protein BeeE
VSLIRRRTGQVDRYSFDQYVTDVNQFLYNGLAYTGVEQTWRPDGGKAESPGAGFDGLVKGAYQRNGIVFACQVARLKVFSEARFQFQQLRRGRPGDLFGTADLAVLEKPWVNGSTGELLARMIQDVDLSGNFFARRTSPTARTVQLERLRPDWMLIVLGDSPDLIEPSVVGYAYYPGGIHEDKDPVFLARDEVAHWSPVPDPSARYRGMSWLAPVIREIRSDSGFTDHKQQFLDHAATPNMVVRMDPAVTPEKFQRFRELMDSEHRGTWNAWKTLYLAGAVDVSVVGNSFKDMDFKAVQGAGETRIAAAAGVPPIVVGLSEGLDAATYSNYAQARRAFADTTIRPLWRSACAALESVVRVPSQARLWYDDRDIPFLQEDRKDAAEIQATQGQTIATLVREGYEPDSVVAAVESEVWSLLRHSGALSVQLFKPGDDPASGQQADTGDDQRKTAEDVALTLQRLYLPVNQRKPLLSVEEARTIANQIGAGLTGAPPDEEEPPPQAQPAALVSSNGQADPADEPAPN